MKIKICGITTQETAQVVETSGAHFIGFVFAPSKRKVSPTKASEITRTLSARIQKVGVFVNESKETIIEIAEKVGLNYIQLHGSESADFAKSLPYPIIKAFSIDEVDQQMIDTYPCDYLLIDSPGVEYEGGSGKRFNWDRLNDLTIDKEKLILAGGLSPDNINEAINAVAPAGVDVSSGVETDNIKDHVKINNFVANVNIATKQMRK